MPSLLDELFDWLRIPSVSSGGVIHPDLTRAAEWVSARIVAAGGKAMLVDGQRNPMTVGRLDSGREGAPTVLIYGHYDVQSAEPADAWTSAPFEPTIRDGRIYARGASDDKGNFLPLLHVACDLASRNELPVNVRVLVEGEEEIGGESVVEWVRDDSEGADCAVVFDAGMLNESTPSITLGVRGHIGFDISIRTAESNLHSGLYGGSVVNAAHVMHRILAEVMPDPDGRLREELRVGIVPPTQAELDSWATLPPGDDVLAEVGAMPLTPRSGAEYYVRNWADASLDIAGVSGGDAFQIRTIVPSTATATFNMRLAPGQRTDEILPVLKRLITAAVPAGVEITDIKTRRGEAALFSATEPAIVLAAEALHEATGVKPAFVRSGGSIPILAAFADRGIPTILSGFGLPQDRIHAPDESFRVKSLELAERSARALYPLLSRLEVGTR